MSLIKSIRLASKSINPIVSQISKREIHLSKASMLASKEFDEAKARLSTLTEDPGNEVKLKLYALFKQATTGPCNTPKPSMVDFVNRAKWNAWAELKPLSQTDAEKKYIDIVNDLVKQEPQAAPVDSSSSAGSFPTRFQDISASVEYNNVYKIVLNRPAKYNAITKKMYAELIEALKEADANPKILMVCITGAGNYYCSGNDLSNFSTKEALQNIKQAAVDGGVLLENFVNSFVTFSKPIVGVINGPAVGISVTILGLFDYVIATDKATFVAPFTKIAQSPEACSTYTFPRMMGNLKASEFLLFNRKLEANEALRYNLVTEVIPHADFEKIAWQRVEEFSKLPKESLLESRRVLRSGDVEVLKKVNKKECDVLVARWSSSEFMKVITEFWKPKTKL